MKKKMDSAFHSKKVVGIPTQHYEKSPFNSLALMSRAQYRYYNASHTQISCRRDEVH